MFLFYLFEVTATLHINYPMKIRIDIEAEVRSFGFPIPISIKYGWGWVEGHSVRCNCYLEKKVDLLETIIILEHQIYSFSYLLYRKTQCNSIVF